MDNSINKNPVELSYFRLSLLSFLKDNHPDKAKDKEFIAVRADSAAESYSVAIKQGLSHDEATEIANVVLYEGLHFSVFQTLVEVIQNEFENEIPTSRVRQAALEIFPLLKPILKQYDLSDDFATTPGYSLLYSELTGMVQLWIENGLQ